MTNELKVYIEENQLCSEYMFRNWLEFLELVYAQESCVESILWFEHTSIIKQKNSLGAGGYRDKSNPGYMYAETHIYETDMEKMSFGEVKAYIESIISTYPNNVLIPSFDIKNNNFFR